MRQSTLFVAIVVTFVCAAPIAASKVMQNRAYVTSGPDRFGSVFYARCVPAAARGSAGRTEVFRVREGGDEVVDRYEWYAPCGLVLGWSPIKGKVAVLAIVRDESAAEWGRREQLRFSIGGEHLASYTNDDLIAMGAGRAASSAYGLHAGFSVIGCEQVPGTNEYDFVIEIGPEKRLRFDITTGRVRATR